MIALPLSSLHTTVRARLESLAVEWLGFDPWRTGGWRDKTNPVHPRCLPLHLGAGFDLGVRLAADIEGVPFERFVLYLHGVVWDVSRYGQITDATERLRAILLDLGDARPGHAPKVTT